MNASKVLTKYFLENRSRIIELAAYIDRIESAENREEVRRDLRWRVFRKALHALSCEKPNRVQEVQEILANEVY